MKHRYRNPWHKSEGRNHSDYGPEFYTTDTKPIEYRGFQIFNRVPSAWELVKDGVCLTQRAGRNGPRKVVDALYGEGEDPMLWAVREVAERFGVSLPVPNPPY